ADCTVGTFEDQSLSGGQRLKISGPADDVARTLYGEHFGERAGLASAAASTENLSGPSGVCEDARRRRRYLSNTQNADAGACTSVFTEAQHTSRQIVVTIGLAYYAKIPARGAIGKALHSGGKVAGAIGLA